MIADALRRQAHVFTDLVELQSKLGRDSVRASGPAEGERGKPNDAQLDRLLATEYRPQKGRAHRGPVRWKVSRGLLAVSI